MKYSSIINNKQKRAILIPIVVALFAQLYFYPIPNDLKLTAGVIALNVILLMETELSALYIGFSSGISIVSLRILVDVLSNTLPFYQSAIRHLPTICFYATFALLSHFSLKLFTKNLLSKILIFIAIDGVSNLCESIARNDININVIKAIIITAILRSLISNAIYQIYRNQKLFILNTEHQHRYTQLNIMISNIHAEVFYLKKSVKDINNVMSKSYSMYEKYKSNAEIGKASLDISREIHEIRKDYDRILKGFETLIDNVQKEDNISLSNIFAIIKDNTDRIIKQNNLKIKVSFQLDSDFEVKAYYNLFAVLNNLIVNAIDACEEDGIIKISSKAFDKDIIFIVENNGKGMEVDIVPYIFQPGFTTKFNEITGKASTGIGLYHVKNIVEDLGGVIDVTSRPDIGTKFVITIPKYSL